MLSVLMLSKEGEGYEIATALAREGNLVKVWTKEANYQDVGKGIKSPQRVSDYKPHLQSADLVLFGASGLGTLANRATGMGRLVLGGGPFQDLIEMDRSYGLQVAGITKASLPKSVECKTPEEGLKLLEKWKEPVALKPFENRGCGLTLVSIDDKNEMIKSFLKTHGKEVSNGFLLQEVVKGIEISTEGWFNGNEFVTPFNHTIEQKRFLEGDKGPNTGCMGNIVWFANDNRITDALLKPLVPLLKKVSYVGPIDANAIISEDKCYFLEWTPRFGYDAIQAFIEGLKMPLSDFLYGVATGTLKRMRVNWKYNIAVALSLPPWPETDISVLKKIKGYKVIQVPSEASRHFWPADLMINEEGDLVMAGCEGKIGCVTACGDSIREARRRAYRTINNIKLSNDIQYREDIGSNVESQITQLQTWGWLNKGETKDASV